MDLAHVFTHQMEDKGKEKAIEHSKLVRKCLVSLIRCFNQIIPTWPLKIVLRDINTEKTQNENSLGRVPLYISNGAQNLKSYKTSNPQNFSKRFMNGDDAAIQFVHPDNIRVIEEKNLLGNRRALMKAE